MTRTCTSCGRVLESGGFWRDASAPDGLNRKCIECCKAVWRDSQNRRRLGLPAIGAGRKAIRPRDAEPGERWCGPCRQYLPEERFTGSERTCRECRRFQHLRTKYGLTRRDYLVLLSAQEGKCAICQVRDPMYVDHNHETGLVRGLLCQQCNTGLGYFLDSATIMLRASEYLKRNE